MMRFGVVASIGGFAVLMALLSLSNAASNAAPARIPAAAIDTLFAKFVSAHDHGCAVLGIKNGKPDFRKGYGVADSRTLRKIGPETNFWLASLPKPVAATAVMRTLQPIKMSYQRRLYTG